MEASAVKGAFPKKVVPELIPEGPGGFRQAEEDSRGYSR